MVCKIQFAIRFRTAFGSESIVKRDESENWPWVPCGGLLRWLRMNNLYCIARAWAWSFPHDVAPWMYAKYQCTFYQLSPIISNITSADVSFSTIMIAVELGGKEYVSTIGVRKGWNKWLVRYLSLYHCGWIMHQLKLINCNLTFHLLILIRTSVNHIYCKVLEHFMRWRATWGLVVAMLMLPKYHKHI
jgi:hypothetical protein